MTQAMEGGDGGRERAGDESVGGGGTVEVEGRGGEAFHSVTNDGGRSEPFHS